MIEVDGNLGRTELEIQQQEEPEEGMALTGQKEDTPSFWQTEFGQARYTQFKRFMASFLSLVCIKIAEVAGNTRLDSVELIAHLAANVSTIACCGIFLLLVMLLKRLVAYSHLLSLGTTSLYVAYLILCDERLYQYLFEGSIDDTRVSNHIFIVLTLSIFITTYGLTNKLALCNFVVLALVFVGVSAVIDHNWTVLWSKTLVLLLIFTGYKHTSPKMVSSTMKYVIYTEHNGAEPANENIEQALKACDLIAESIQQAETSKNPLNTHSKLQAALRQIRKVKKQIATGPEIDYIPVEDMDEEERAFCLEHYTKFVPNKKRGNRGRNMTLFQVMRRESATGDIGNLLNGLGRMWNFDVTLIADTAQKCIEPAANHLFITWKLNNQFSIDSASTSAYFTSLEQRYFSNPYHNAMHAVDVLHSLIYFITRSSLAKETTLLEILAMCIAALGHDVAHPALNNKFLMTTKHKLAILYNDSSVLESMHASTTFEVMDQPGCNILQTLRPEDYATARKMIIEMILGTDMSKHFESYNRFSAKLATNSLSMQNTEDRAFVFGMGLKCADIGHSAKNLALHLKWTEKISEEFFAQGDLEKLNGIPVSAGFDREGVNLAKSQAGFLKFICLPLYESWASFLCSTEIDENCVRQLRDNITHWEGSDLQRTKTLTSTSPGRFLKQKTMRY